MPKVHVYNEMGHVVLTPRMPVQLERFLYKKVFNHIDVAMDSTGLGCRFYILKPALKDKWTYYYNDGTPIDVDFSGLNKFNSKTMKMLGPA